ncbi:hypothetical protein J8F10_32025 [Gemmata sp. G18]|uniref:Secreted protein n=1 Tax=Gemmata palustris TaxID=2822762 RepID=A0ABS5C1U7_9BACT|nr:hypothetical protein [Gemmata palustris]MBP3959898.1 hypothetical protein [Gemmata palustris]
MLCWNWVIVLILSATPLANAPVPKDVEKEKQERFRKLRETYDQKLKDLGDSDEGKWLQITLLTAKVIAKETVEIDAFTDPATRQRLTEYNVRSLARLFRDEPDVLEPYLLYCYELRNEPKKKP